MATDEAILGRTIGRDFRRDAHGRLDNPGALYRPYLVRGGWRDIACLFRDHTLSDLIGFVYGGWNSDAAAADFVNRLVEGGRRFSATSSGEATIAIILDGENAWEYFEGGGRPFLRALYARLSDHPELRAVTMREATASAGQKLTGLFPGSWIDANFFIWIGHGDDLRAWRQLREARQTYARVAPNASSGDREQAWQELLISEGSDWFWWYGDDHSSDHDLEFDDLFRRHLRNVYLMLGQPPPEELFTTNISTSQVPLSVVTPVGLLNPALDGEPTSYFEWLAAGRVETGRASGVMTVGERREPIVSQLLYGFDLRHLFVRLDLGSSAIERLVEGIHCSVNFTVPKDVRLTVSLTDEPVSASLLQRAGDQWRPVDGARPRVAAAQNPRGRRVVLRSGARAQPAVCLFRVSGDRGHRTRAASRTQAGGGSRPRTRIRKAALAGVNHLSGFPQPCFGPVSSESDNGCYVN